MHTWKISGRRIFLLGLVLSVFKTGAVQKDEWEQNRNFEEKQVFLKSLSAQNGD